MQGHGVALPGECKDAPLPDLCRDDSLPDGRYDSLPDGRDDSLPDLCRDVACHVWVNTPIIHRRNGSDLARSYIRPVIFSDVAHGNFFRRGTPRPYICRLFSLGFNGIQFTSSKKRVCQFGHTLFFNVCILLYVYSFICSYSLPMRVDAGMLIATAS